MPPRSLLFSSDRETSKRMAQALQELELQVEQCSEVFEAIKRLTSHGYELVIADWDEGLEAAFLLQTTRDLKLNRKTFALAIASRELAAAAQQAGAQLVLSKPVLPGYAKYALLSDAEFFARMQTWRAQEPASPLPLPSVAIHPTRPQAAKSTMPSLARPVLSWPGKPSSFPPLQRPAESAAQMAAQKPVSAAELAGETGQQAAWFQPWRFEPRFDTSRIRRLFQRPERTAQEQSQDQLQIIPQRNCGQRRAALIDLCERQATGWRLRKRDCGWTLSADVLV